MVWSVLCLLVCVAAHLAWLVLLLPVHLYSPALYSHLEGILFSWTVSLICSLIWSAGYSIVESGESLDKVGFNLQT